MKPSLFLGLGVWLILSCSTFTHLLGQSAQTDPTWKWGRVLSSPRKQAVVLSHGSPALAVVFAPDGRTIVTGCADGSLHFWALPRKKEVRYLRGHKGRVNALAFTPDGKLLASAGVDGFVRLWSVPDGKEKRAIETRVGKVAAVAISPDGRFVAAGGNRGLILVWQLASGRQTFEWKPSALDKVDSVVSGLA